MNSLQRAVIVGCLGESIASDLMLVAGGKMTNVEIACALQVHPLTVLGGHAGKEFLKTSTG